MVTIHGQAEDEVRRPPALPFGPSLAATADAESAHCARILAEALRTTKPSDSTTMAARAARTLVDRGHSGSDGAFGSAAGRVFECMDARLSTTPISTSRVTRFENPSHPVVDAVLSDASGTEVLIVSRHGYP